MAKLVRDKIPEIMKAKNQDPVTKIADNDEEYLCLLKEKLIEEVSEFIEACTSTATTDPEEELADIFEVVDAICKFKNYNLDSIQNKKAEKFLKKGGFNDRIILI
jgi:predicted house-cleaning noncanonical NTP pyrophosphatase (MazG superfamily)